MKAYDLKPTNENLLKTYKEDTIGRNADLFSFTTILDTIDEGCSIALDGNWGSGKTFFAKQVKMVLDVHNAHISSETDEYKSEIVAVRNRHYGKLVPELQPQVCVYYDAWENDNDDDPILSLVYTILNSVETDFSFKSTDCVKVGASIMEFFTGRNWEQLIVNLKGESPLDSLKEHKELEKLVGEFLETLLSEKGNRLVVLIDELDRCKPSYAVRMLERVKHYFDHENITFVFSVNTNELQHTIRKYYGNDFDGSRYLDRFFDLRVMLPPPDLKKFYRSINFDDSYYLYDIACGAVIKAFRFELREIAKFIRISKIAAYVPTRNGGRGLSRGMQFCLYFVVPIMIGLKVQSTQQFADFIEGRDCTPLIEVGRGLQLRHYDCLLGSNETYDQADQGRCLVTVEDKLREVYKAMFLTEYDGDIYRISIGELSFNANTKGELLRIAGLMSRYTNLDIDP